MSDLNEKELRDDLLDSLSKCWKSYGSGDRIYPQAYAQLRKIVEGHFSKPSGMAPTVFSEKMVEDY